MKTWLRSPPWQTTGGRSPKSVVTSAMYLYALAATISVLRSAPLRSNSCFSVVGGCANSRMAPDDRGHAPEAIAGALEGRRDALAQVVEVGVVLGLADALEQVGGDGTGGGSGVDGRLRGLQRHEVAEGLAQEADRVADELDRGVDLVGDPGRELADGLELLRQAQLGLHQRVLGLRVHRLGDVEHEALQLAPVGAVGEDGARRAQTRSPRRRA